MLANGSRSSRPGGCPFGHCAGAGRIHLAGFPVVLVAEDEAVIAMALADDLEAAGYAVAGAFATCESALQWLKDETPDLAVLDPMLKDGTCRELAIEFRGVVFRLRFIRAIAKTEP